MAYLSWDALRGASIAPQALEWGANLELHSDGNTITIAPADIVTMLIFVLDTAVTQEGRQPRADKFARARTSLGGSAGATFSGYTASVATGQGVVLVHTASGNSFHVTESHKFAVAVANLCELKEQVGLLQRS